jgi:tetratricopeptide (TPR) repeat protein
MKHTLLLLAAFIACYSGLAQTDTKHTPRRLSHDDSAKVEYYWRKANSVRLFSQQRQRYLDSALAIAPWRAYFWQQKAMPLSKQMKHDLAKPFLDSAVKYDPNKYMPYRGYTRCIFSRDYREAMEDFYGAKALNGNSGVMDHPYDFFIGLCHLQLDNFDSARQMVQQCIDHKIKQHGPEWAHYLHWFYVGITWYEQDNDDSAIACFNKSLGLNPYLPDAKYYKALCLSRTGQKKEALAILYEVDSLLKKGYFINEDNARYEVYPYQVRKYFLEGAIASLEKDKE